MFNLYEDGVWGTFNCFNTKEEAIKNGESYYYDPDENTVFYVGQISTIVSSVGVNVDMILEDIGEQVNDEIGEAADGYLYDVVQGHSEILEQRLNEVILRWMEEFNYTPSFFRIENTERIEIELNRRESQKTQ